MSNNKKDDVTLEELIIQINEVLKEIKNEQVNMKKMIEQKHKVNMQKFSKLIEYDEICDMTNQVFEKRISNIERTLQIMIQRKSETK